MRMFLLRLLFTAFVGACVVAAPAALQAPDSVAAASPNGQHPDITEEAPYCGPGMRLEGARCEVIRRIDTGPSLGEWAMAGLGLFLLFVLA
jgi:hypothetical protein